MTFDPVITLSLFPDTGHQFFTIDLEDLLRRTKPKPGAAPTPPATFDRICRFVETQMPNAAPSAAGRQQLAGWQPWAETTPWILYRYDFVVDADRGQPRPVLQLAIESNLGDFDRGSLVSLQHSPPGGGGSPHPLHEVLRRAQTHVAEPDPAEDPLLPYAARHHELATQWGDGTMWLEDAFGGGRRRLPARRVPGAAATPDLDFFLPEETIRIEWAKSQGDRPVEVDLIVDLGNTRTVALLLEDHGVHAEETPFGVRAEPLRFLPRGWAFDHPGLDSSLEPFGVIDSWVLLHRSPFANLEPPFSDYKLRSYRAEPLPGREVVAHLIDQRFVALAPVLIGGGREPTGAAKTLAQAVMSRGAKERLFFLSSPKRYAWDDTSIGSRKQFWWQIANRHDAETGLVRLEGMIRYFMNPSSDRHDVQGASLHGPAFTAQTDYMDEAKYPLANATCWFALAVLEAARRQINSIDFLRRSKLPRSGVVRRLRRVRVTYPAGWPGEEREAYLGQWRRALRLFGAAHFADSRPQTEGGDTPTLVEDSIDEAVASQLPILVAELRAFGQDAREWLSLYGDGEQARVMNIDIGGGTTDVAVVRYSEPLPDRRVGLERAEAAELRAELLHRHGSPIAGDRLVKRLIERVLLPAWLRTNTMVFAGNRAACDLLRDLFSAPREEPIVGRDPDASAKLSRLVRLALVPLANAALTRLTVAEAAQAAHLPPLPVAEVVDRKVIDELNLLVLELVVWRCERWGDLGPAQLRALRNPPAFIEWINRVGREAPGRLPFSPSAVLTLAVAALHAAIDEVFTPLVRRVAEQAQAQGCDLVIVSGKPSELGRVRSLVERALPLPAQRILRVQGYRVGDWYPPSLVEAGGRIRDAKTVTVTGAGLYEDIKNRNTRGLRVALPRVGEHPLSVYHYGLLGDHGMRRRVAEPLFARDTPAGQTRELPMALFTPIGRWLDESAAPDPVYRLEYRLHESEAEPPGLREQLVRLRLRLAVDPPLGERLEIVPGSVQFLSGGAGLDPSRVCLRLRTMIEMAFWMDAPAFDLDLTGLGATE